MAINFNSVDLYKYTEEEFLVIKKIIPYSIVRHAFIYHNIKGQDYNNLDLKPIYYEDLILPMEKNMILMILKELLRKHLLDNIEYDDEKITLFTTMGDIRIRGAGLQINSAFSDSNSVEIKGNVRALFFGDNKEKYNDNFISRIFR